MVSQRDMLGTLQKQYIYRIHTLYTYELWTSYPLYFAICDIWIIKHVWLPQFNIERLSRALRTLIIKGTREYGIKHLISILVAYICRLLK